jgi:hypothetical protein
MTSRRLPGKRVRIWQGVLEKTEYRVMLLPADGRRHRNDPYVSVEFYDGTGKTKSGWVEIAGVEAVYVLSKVLILFWRNGERARMLLEQCSMTNPEE